MAFHIFRANIYKYFITLFRAYPRSFFIGSIMHIFEVILFGYMMYEVVFEGAIDPSFVAFTGTKEYMTYILVGAFMYSFTVSTLMNVSRSMITERRMGTLESIFLAPYNRGMYFLAYMTAQTIHTLGELVFAIPILWLFHVVVPGFNLLSFGIVLLLTLYAFLGLSLVLGSFMLYTRDTYLSQNTLFSIIFLVCGISFPKEYLPYYIQWISHIIPVTHSVRMFRNIIINQMSIMSQSSDILALLILGTIYIIIGFTLLPKVEKNAIENIHG